MLFLEEWITFLSRLDRLGGVPLIVGGVGLMLLGWRMRRLSVGLAFGLIGAAATMLLGSKDVPVWYAVAGGMALASMSMWLADHAATVLGGLLGAGFTMISLGGIGFSGSALYAGGGLAFLAFAAFSYLHRPHVRIITTAFLGAVLAGVDRRDEFPEHPSGHRREQPGVVASRTTATPKRLPEPRCPFA